MPDKEGSWRTSRPWGADAIVCDGLLPWVADLLPPDADLVAQLRRFHRSGIDHVSLTAAVGRDSATQALTTLGGLRRAIAGNSDWIRVASDQTEIARAADESRLTVSFHFQTATPFAEDLDLVDAFHAAGIRRAILAYNTANIFADGCHEPRNGGLTELGFQLVRRMDRVGMVVDLSHCGVRSTFDALDAGLNRPPIFSHSNAGALYEHPRNISDEQIRAARDARSFIGVSGVGFFLDAATDDIPRAMSEHVAHIASIAGAEHVGLGLDFMYLDGSDYGFFHANRGAWPVGYPDPPWHFLQPEQLGDLVTELERRGFGDDDVMGILGGNYLRLVAD